jgi:type IV secretion system protein VirD4
MRKLPENIDTDGLLVGWSLEAGHRKNIIGFTIDQTKSTHPAMALEPILDTGDGHLITVAPTGSGKGTGCIIPALLRYQGPVIVVDPKGENYAVTAQRRRQMGQEVFLLDPFEICDTEERHRFNPLDLANPHSPRFVEDISTLTSLISISQQDNTGNFMFWDGMGRSLITAAILDVLSMEDSDDASLGAVRNLINSPLDTLQERAKRWRKEGIPELRRLTALLLSPADETIGGYLAHAIRQLDFLKGKQMEEHFSCSDLDLNKIYDGSPVTIYLVLPADKLESHAALLRLWIGTFISIITRRRTLPPQHTLLLVDEAAQLGYLPQLKQAITLLRGFGVRVWTFWQDISQIKNLYPLDWETIFNNCRVQQFFGATTGIAAKAVSEISGFRDYMEVMDLEFDEMILNIPGDEPVVVAKPNYLRDPVFHGLYTANPFYGQVISQEASPLRARPIFTKTSSPSAKRKTMVLRQDMILAQQIFLPIGEENWKPIEGERKLECLRLSGIEDQVFLENPLVQVRQCYLPFYKDYDWYEITDKGRSPGEKGYLLMDDKEAWALTGSSDSIYSANDKHLSLTSANVLLYLRFFCSNICCEQGRFLVLDRAEQLEWTLEPDPDYLAALKTQIMPPRIKEIQGEGAEQVWITESEMVYNASVYTTLFSIHAKDGMVVMEDEQLVAPDLPIVNDLLRLRYVGSYGKDGKFVPLRS